jgi:GNAT superfamily N-acetyltransferase
LYQKDFICLFIRSHNDQIIGTISGSLEVKLGQLTGHIYTLAIDPGYRRQGLGSQLIVAFEKYIRTKCDDCCEGNLSLTLEFKVPNSLSYDLKELLATNSHYLSTTDDSNLFYSYLLSPESMPGLFYCKLGFKPEQYYKSMYGLCEDGLRMRKVLAS